MVGGLANLPVVAKKSFIFSSACVLLGTFTPQAWGGWQVETYKTLKDLQRSIDNSDALHS